MDIERRYEISDRMGAAGINKCFDCCLVPDCEVCGPCDRHPSYVEEAAAEAWMREESSNADDH